jgi:hypothetical protein
MENGEKDMNPFAHAKTKEEREKVWKSLRAISGKPLSKEETDQLIREAIRLQKDEK